MKLTSLFLFLCQVSLVFAQNNQQQTTNLKALLYFDNLIHQNPNNAEAYTQRGMGYFYTGEYENAIKDFDKAIQLRPNSADLFYFRAVSKESDGMYQESLKDFDKAIQLSAVKPNYFHFMHRGFARYNLAMYTLALEDFNKAIAMSPDNDELVQLRKDAAEKVQASTPAPVETSTKTNEVSNPTPKTDANVTNANPANDPKGYIETHQFESIADGASYYDKLQHMGLSPAKFKENTVLLKKKLISDVYGDAPFASEIEDYRSLLDDEKWLLPEGMEKYFYYISDNPNYFTGEIKVPNLTYYFTAIKDPQSNQYDLTIKSMGADEMVNFAFNTYINTQQGATRDEIIVNIHYAENIGNLNWKYYPSEYLEVTYDRLSNTVKERAVGNKMQKCTVEAPSKPKNVLLQKDTKKAFSEKEAIRKAVEVLLIAYTNIIKDL